MKIENEMLLNYHFIITLISLRTHNLQMQGNTI